jgi:FkbM family methyltransferase
MGPLTLLKRKAPNLYLGYEWLRHMKGGEAEYPLVRHFVRRGRNAIDVGAHMGLYSYELARWCSRVYSFEVNPALAAFAAAALPNNVQVHAVGLSSKCGSTTLRIPRSTSGKFLDALATVERRNDLEGLGGDITTVAVSLARLDDFGFEDVDLVKIDVEGHEEAVLAGAGELIATQRPVFLIEIEERHNPGAIERISGSLSNYGYHARFLFRGALIEMAGFDPTRHQDARVIREHLFDPRRTIAYVNNFMFFPGERDSQIVESLSRAL